MHVSKACSMAAAIQADSAAPNAVGAIASFGGDGKNPSHQERDMRSWLAKFTGIDFEPYEIFLTLKKHGTVGKELVTVLPIHEMLAHSMRANMTEIFFHDWNQCADYWLRLATTEYGKRHTANTDPSLVPFRPWTVPAVIHHDDVEAFGECPFAVFSWSSPLVTGDPWLRKLLITAIETNQMVDEATVCLEMQGIGNVLQLLHAIASDCVTHSCVSQRLHLLGGVVL